MAASSSSGGSKTEVDVEELLSKLDLNEAEKDEVFLAREDWEKSPGGKVDGGGETAHVQGF